MKLLNKPNIIVAMLLLSFCGFLFLSCWLLFRDVRALIGIGNLYPDLKTPLFEIQNLLLRYGLNTLPTLFFGILAIISFGAYLASLRTKINLRKTVLYAVIFQAIIFFSYPILSTDIFSYMFSDRVFTEYGQNIWKVSPDTFRDDPYEIFSDWRDQTKVYGAVNQIIYLPASYLGGENFILTVLLYKAVSLIFSLATLLVVLRLTKSLDLDKRSSIVRMIFWNPLFILEILGSGHNDIAMLFFFLLSYLFYERKQWFVAGIVLALSVQVKMITIIFFGFAMLQLLQNKRFSELAKFAVGFILINVASFWYMHINPLEFLSRVFYNTSVYWQSLPSLVHKFFINEKPVFTFMLVAMLIGLLLTQLRQKLKPLLVSTLFLLGYLFFFTAAYWNWYVLWVLLLVPFCRQKWLSVTVLIFSFTSLTAYPLLWLSQRFAYENILWQFVFYFWIFVVPLISSLVFIKKPKIFLSITDYFTKMAVTV